MGKYGPFTKDAGDRNKDGMQLVFKGNVSGHIDSVMKKYRERAAKLDTLIMEYEHTNDIQKLKEAAYEYGYVVAYQTLEVNKLTIDTEHLREMSVISSSVKEAEKKMDKYFDALGRK